MTAPTIGRVVYYRPSVLEVAAQNICQLDATQPFRADVVFVQADGTVNLTVCDHAGQSLLRTDVSFFETEQADIGAHAHWMPYQVATAAKTAAETPAAPAPGEAPPVP